MPEAETHAGWEHVDNPERTLRLLTILFAPLPDEAEGDVEGEVAA